MVPVYKYKPICLPFIFLLLLSILSCTQNKEQEEFEKEAYSLPENITETGDNGAIVEGRTDPDDWRIAPFFQGVVIIDPPFPNPLLTNQRLNLYVNPSGLDAVNGLRIFALYENGNLRPVREDFRSPLPPGAVHYSLSALDIAQFPENPEGLYRIIVEDGQRRVISYGDVKIE